MKVNVIKSNILAMPIFKISNSNSRPPDAISQTQNASMTIDFKSILDSFLIMWLPMFAAMAIRLPGVGSLPKPTQVPVEVFLKAGLGLLMSEILKLISGTKLTHTKN